MKMLSALCLVFGLSTLSIAAPPKKEESSKQPSEEAVKIAKALTPTQGKKLMAIINEGDEEALTALPNIGPKLAAAIKKARPVKEAVDLVLIDGIGEATLSGLVKHAKDGFPSKEADSDESKSKSKSTKKKKS